MNVAETSTSSLDSEDDGQIDDISKMSGRESSEANFLGEIFLIQQRMSEQYIFL